MLLLIALDSQHQKSSDNVAKSSERGIWAWRYLPTQTQDSFVPMVKCAPLVDGLGCDRTVAAADTRTHPHCCKVAVGFICGSEGFHPRNKAFVLPGASRCFCLLGGANASQSERGVRICYAHLSGTFVPTAGILIIASLQDRRRLTQKPSGLLSSAPRVHYLHLLQPASQRQSIV